MTFYIAGLMLLHMITLVMLQRHLKHIIRNRNRINALYMMQNKP